VFERIGEAVQIQADLKVVDRKVLCPASGTWERVETCEHCASLVTVTPRRNPDLVRCAPEVANLSAALRNLIRS
jgi:hypothetical protein